MSALLRHADHLVQTILRWLCTILFIALALILITNVTMRVMNDASIKLNSWGMTGAGSLVKSLVPITSMHWFDEVVELCFASLVFYGAAALWALKGHFSVGDWISKYLPYPRLRVMYKAFVTLLSVVFIAVFFYFSLRLVEKTTELSTVFQIHKSVFYSCMPISSGIMLMYSLVELVEDLILVIKNPPDQVSTQKAQSL